MDKAEGFPEALLGHGAEIFTLFLFYSPLLFTTSDLVAHCTAQAFRTPHAASQLLMNPCPMASPSQPSVYPSPRSVEWIAPEGVKFTNSSIQIDPGFIEYEANIK